MQVLSIQSSVAYGHAGNNAAVFPLQRLGIEVWPVSTVAFSNHTGYGAWRGPVHPVSDVAEVLAGVADRGVYPHLDAVLSGYQGTAEVGGAILDAVEAVRAVNPDAVYCADPVMGDRGRGIYVRPGIPEFMRDAVLPRADITTPNQFELEFITGRQIRSVDDLLAAIDDVRSRGPEVVLVTSVELPELPMEKISMIAADDSGAWLVTTPKLDIAAVAGSGDMTTALFLGHRLRTSDLGVVLASVASSVFGVIEQTAQLGSREMEIVAAQEHIANPRREFAATQVR